jgi:predicted cobalt transporter CbtA
MRETAIFICIFAGMFVSLMAGFLPLILILSGERWKAAEDTAHARRIADAKMNARLLRLNL